jgi:hypothetical protein
VAFYSLLECLRLHCNTAEPVGPFVSLATDVLDSIDNSEGQRIRLPSGTVARRILRRPLFQERGARLA